MISLQGLSKPQYLFRPMQILRRLARGIRPVKQRETVRLPWKLAIEVESGDTVGTALIHQGVYDILTTEVVWRLTRAGDATIDAGAHAGYFTSLLASRAGPRGAVYAWEPHPETFRLLRRNVDSWSASKQLAPITLFQAALSNQEKMARLSIPPGQEKNSSHAFLDSQAGAGISIRAAPLAQFLNSTRPIGVMKLDVESHESQVLEGAGEDLRAGRIRDIIFEEHAPFPARSHEILFSAGYKIYWFKERLRGPVVIMPTERPRRREYDITPSYLATRDPESALRALAESGWKSF